MKKCFIILACLSWLLSAISCKGIIYSPSETNFISVDRPTEGFTVDLTTQTDTVYAWGQTRLRFHSDHSRNAYRFGFAVVYLDSIIISKSERLDEFIFESTRFRNGIHKLRIEVWAHTQSHSLADLLDAEFFVGANDWPMIIDNTYPAAPINLASMERRDGGLQINWENYSCVNFQEYRIVQVNTDRHGYKTEKLRAVITDRKTTFWHDSLYVGGAAIYRVDLKAMGAILKGDEKPFTDEATKVIKLQTTPENHVLLAWEKSSYHKSFQFYTLQRGIRYSFGDAIDFEDLYTTSLISDTTYIDKTIGFGNAVIYRVLVGPGFFSAAASALDSTDLGLKCPPHYEIKYIAPLNSIYLNDDIGSSYRLDATNFRILATANRRVDITSDGSAAFAYDGNYDSKVAAVHRINPLTLEVIETILTESLVGYQSFFERIVVAQPALIFYSGYKWQNYNWWQDTVSVLDLNAKKLIAKSAFTPEVTYATHNGRYLLTTHWGGTSQLHEVINNSFRAVGNIESGAFFQFLPDGEHYITTDKNYIAKLKCKDQTLVQRFPIAASLKTPMIDPATGYLGGYSVDHKKYRIYNLQTGNLVAEINLALSSLARVSEL